LHKITSTQTVIHKPVNCIVRSVSTDRLTDGRTDGQTDELIWGGLGNLRFLQVNPSSLPNIFIVRPVGTMVSHCGAIFSPVASGTVIVCKNNTRVLGRSGRAGARAEKRARRTQNSDSDIGIIPRWHVPRHLPPPCPYDYAKQRPHNMMRMSHPQRCDVM
jgi:hypothetical protein